MTGYHHFDAGVQFVHPHARLRKIYTPAQYKDCQMHLGMVHRAFQEPQEIFTDVLILLKYHLRKDTAYKIHYMQNVALEDESILIF